MNPGHKPPKLVCQHHERFTSFSCAVDDLLEEIQHSPAKDSQRIITTCVNCNFQVYVIQITRIPTNSWGRTSRHIEKTLLAPIPQVHDSVALLLKGSLHTAGSYYFKNVSLFLPHNMAALKLSRNAKTGSPGRNRQNGKKPTSSRNRARCKFDKGQILIPNLRSLCDNVRVLVCARCS